MESVSDMNKAQRIEAILERIELMPGISTKIISEWKYFVADLDRSQHSKLGIRVALIQSFFFHRYESLIQK